MKIKNKAVLILIIFWLMIVSVFVINEELIIQKGGEVLLKVKPHDPKDLMRGDYVSLAYDINTPFGNESGFLGRHATVFVILDIDKNNVAQFKSYQFEKPKKGVFIKGKCTSTYSDDIITVKYGIESYFVKQNTGRDVERRLSNGGFAKVRINKSGRAKITDLIY